MGIILNPDKICANLKQGIKDELVKKGPSVLASVVLNDDYSLKVYISSQKKLAEELGVKYILVDIKGVSFEVFLKKMEELNKDPSISGIIVNKPLPKGWHEEDVFDSIAEKKDIEGLSSYNLRKVISKNPVFVSPTVLSIMEFIKMSGFKIRGKDTVIVGFSNLVGVPLSFLMAKELSTVTITHIATYESGSLPFYVNNADILISAVGIPELIKGKWIKKGAVVIDVGMGEKDGRICGDVEFLTAKEKASYITPVPGGVGRLTPIFLFCNFTKAVGL